MSAVADFAGRQPAHPGGGGGEGEQSRSQPGTRQPNSSASRRSLRVVQVVGTFGGGGAERMAWNLAVGMARIGQHSRCLALKSAGSFSDEADDRVELDALGLGGGLGRIALSGLAKLRSWLGEAGCDIVHVHGSGSLPLIVAATRGMKHRPHIVFTWHDSGSVLGGGGWRRAMMIAALRRCDLLYGSSRGVCERLDRALKQPAGRGARVMRNGVPRRTARGSRSSPPLIAWLGRFVPDKDPQSLVRACATLHAEGRSFRLVLAGAAPKPQQWYFDQTKALIRDSGLDGVASMPGWTDDAAALLDQAAIAVQTSHTEGLSMTLLEAMMSHAAVVATSVGDTAAVVKDGATGVLVEPGDTESLTRALRQLLDQPADRERLAAAGHRLVCDHYTLEAAAERVAMDYAENLAS